jgi:hypothetical protein
MAAVAEMVRAHGEDGVEAARRPLPGAFPARLEGTQDLDKRLGFLVADLAGVAEELLELIEEKADVAVSAEAEAFLDAGKRRPAAVQQASHGPRGPERRLGVSLQLLVQTRDRYGEVPQRRAARAHLGGAPRDAVPRVLLLEARQHAGRDQRGLATPRAAVNHDQLRGREPIKHGIDHRFAAEEDRPFVLLERSQAGIGARERRPRAHLRSSAL